MENKQTALNWLKKKCEDSLNKEPDNPSEREIGYSIALKHFITLIENEAKAMEKEQMIEFADRYGFDVCAFDYDRAEQYYNETYGQN
jgi:hypothetical protein